MKLSRIVFFAAFCGGLALMVGCGPVEEEPDPTPPEEELAWECSLENDGRELCDGDVVLWCHGVAGDGHDGAHFHAGKDCGADGGECVVLGDGNVTACRDPEATCEQGEAKCDGLVSYNCIDGAWAVRRCSIAQDCVVEGEEAVCQAK